MKVQKGLNVNSVEWRAANGLIVSQTVETALMRIQNDQMMVAISLQTTYREPNNMKMCPGNLYDAKGMCLFYLLDCA